MRTLRTLATLILLPAAACTAARPAAPSGLEPVGYDPNVTVEISNNTSSDMDVFAVGNGMRYRLGTVATVGAHSFSIPFQMIRSGQTVRFMAVPYGGGRASIIGAAEVEPGSFVELTIENLLTTGRERSGAQ